MMTKRISLAYSPDTDDAFMIIALKDQLIDLQGYSFDFYRDDIQNLNECARSEMYDVTAISIAAFPGLAQNYLMLPVGSSIGDGYGPIVVAKKDRIQSLHELRNAVVAVPGLQTSAYFSSLHLLPPFHAKPMHFEKIIPAVLSDDVEAGILIHERQISFGDLDLNKIGDLGQLWMQKYGLPLPLGGNAIHRRLGDEHIQNITSLLKQSIAYAFEHRDVILKQAVRESHKEDVLPDDASARRYIDMYVNEDSMSFRPEVRKAIGLMYDRAAAAGLCPAIDMNGSIVSTPSHPN